MGISPGLILLALVVYCLSVAATILILKRSAQRREAELRAAQKPAAADDSLSTSKYLKDRCAQLEQRDVQRRLYLDLNRILSTVTTFDELASKSIDAICAMLEAGFGAFLWKPMTGDALEFKYCRGYGSIANFRLPIPASIAGLSIVRKEPFFIEKPETSVQYVKVPSAIEANVLCAPLRLFHDYRGVIRIANINTKIMGPGELIATFQSIAPLLSSALEKMLVSQENERRKNELEAITGITQTIHRTLELPEICAAAARYLKPIFGYSYLTVVRFGEGDAITPILSIPREIRFTESQATSRIMLRNLCMRREPLLIPNVWHTDLVKCENREIGSLLSIPLYLGGTAFAAIVMAGSQGIEWGQDDMNALLMLGEQVSVTIERAAYFKKQEDQALRDGLTGLLNHRIFQERLTIELQRFQRYGRPFSLVILDIDHFKKFNDTYGHQTGDLVLRAVADCVRTTIRGTDMAFRYGGEEFCALLPETEVDQAAIFAVRLCNNIRNRSVASQAGNLSVTASLGVAQSGSDSKSPNILVDAADKALYNAKNSGRNRVCVYKNGKMMIAG
jgi:diguanylate cyclase (GGDEF)-like protein